MENTEKNKDIVYSSSVRAGKRTYFFDVRENRRGDFYLTITESKKNFDNDGNFKFVKHKVYLYEEDFLSFLDSYNEVIEYVKKEKAGELKKREAYTNNFEENNIDDIVE